MRVKRHENQCYRFECSQCGNLASTQVFYRKDGTVGYSRARHKDAQGFFYHPLPTEYVTEKLGALGKLDQGQYSPIKSIDPNNSESSLELLMARDVRSTPTSKLHAKTM